MGRVFVRKGRHAIISFQSMFLRHLMRMYRPSLLNGTRMPDRTLVSTPEGEVKKLSVEEFLALSERMTFKKNIAHDKIVKLDKAGQPQKDARGNIRV